MELQHFQDIITSLQSAKTVDDLHETCSRLCALGGFEHFHYGTRIPTSFTKPHFIHISGYPAEWWRHYNENQCIQSDPTVAYCAENFTPLRWERVTKQHPGRQASPVMMAARDHGLVSGVSFPAHTPQGDFAMFSLSSSRSPTRMITELEQLTALGSGFTFNLHEAVRRIFARDPLPLRPIQLTLREKETLLWMAEGKTSWEISQILNIAERTVTFHVQNTVQKLNVSNRQQAIARAVAMGMISPQL